MTTQSGAPGFGGKDGKTSVYHMKKGILERKNPNMPKPLLAALGGASNIIIQLQS